MLNSSAKLVIATTNKGKLKEFVQRLEGMDKEIYSLSDFIDVPSVVEDGHTFIENAEKKARIIGNALNMISLADDSGLSVDALDGQPGVYSARYAGEHASDQDNVDKLLRELHLLHAAGYSEGPVKPLHPLGYKLLSPAHFACALVLYDPSSDKLIRVEGTCSGWIIDHPCGDNGFGYDPIFYLPEFGRTAAELSIAEKQKISHRGKALDRLFNQLGL
ncbi:MAG: non-canonical purine NTP pyrophosphatase [Paenibacillaceae bacterium]